MQFDLIGALVTSYTAAQYTAGIDTTPRQGQVYFDRGASKKYIFLKNNGATANTANLCTTSSATDLSAFNCTLMTTSNVLWFAGARVSSADSNAQNERGWFQIGGPASLLADVAGTTVDKGVMGSNATAGRVEAAADATAAEGQYTFGVAETTTASGAVNVNIFFSVWAV